jgi:hypothetical protein
MVSRCLTFVAVAVCASAAVAHADPRAVVELFTSQGCSSCPPADKLLGELANDPSLVSISLPIDYWDYLGWKDTLADPRHTARQKSYAKLRGDREVYTPQVVVNGSLHALGSDRSAIERAVGESRKNPAALALPVLLKVGDGRLSVALPDSNDGHVAEVWICGLTKAITVSIKRGENRGKNITYFNVVRHWMKLDTWDGKAHSWSVPIRDIAADGDVDRAAVLVQAGAIEKPSLMLGAGLASIR